jgi:NifU-like protein involved in Fe-S cluster formation
MLTKYGDMEYVGYIDLTSQSTSTKIFSGKVLDTADQMQDINLEIKTKKCTEPSGDEVDFTVAVKVAEEKLDGCAKLAI